jgi:glycosyltransferase involved in cell wall biosynthesis
MNAPRPPLKVAVDARLVSGERGGVEQVIIGLAAGLSRLSDGDERYFFLVDPGQSDWIEPFVSGPCSLLESGSGVSGGAGGSGSGGSAVGPSRGGGGLRGAARSVIKSAIPAVARARLRRRLTPPGTVPVSDGAIERAGVEVMHFPMQVGFLTSVPTVFAPHDLQHLHLREFFTRAEIAERERRYRTLCDRASVVTLMSTWGRDDIVANYGLSLEKILVVPGASTAEFYPVPTDADTAETTRVLDLPPRFAIYPAKAWPHKNHARLVVALRTLRQRGVDVPVVLTGGQAGRDRPVMAQAEAEGVADLVRFVGYVTTAQMAALYRLGTLMVFPTLFEGWGLPVIEAMAAGLPVASSTVTCLPAVTAGSALLFDPTDSTAIADAIERLWTDESLRRRLAAAGRERAALFSWDRSARMFRACYRTLGRRELTAEDRALLDAAPLA